MGFYGNKFEPLNEEVSTLRQVIMGFQINGITAGSTGKFIKVLRAHENPGAIKFVNKCKKIDELDHFRKETVQSLPSFQRAMENCKKVEELGECKETKAYYKYFKKNIIDNGLSHKDYELLIKWFKETLIPTIDKRKKELKNNQ